MTIKFPKHIRLVLEHNPHNSVYQEIGEYLSITYSENVCWWISEEEKDLAYKNNSFWECQWYPITPIGYYRVFSYSLEKLLEFINSPEENFR